MIQLIVAILLLIGLVRYLVRVPSHLKEVPKIPILSSLKLFSRSRLVDDGFNQFIAPYLTKKGYALSWIGTHWGFIITKPEIIKEIFRNTNQFQKMVSHESYSLACKYSGLKSLARSNGDDWKRFRRPVNPIFHQSFDTAMFAECVTQTLDAFSERIHCHPGEPIGVSDLMKLMTLDVLGKGIFSHDFESVRSMGSSRLNILYASIMNQALDPIFMLIPFLDRFPIGERAKAHSNLAEFNQLTLEFINQRRADLDSNTLVDPKDLLSTLLKEDPDNPYSPLTDEELIHTFNAFFLAGQDTTANTLSFAMYYLAKYPHLQEKLRTEIYNILQVSESLGKMVIPTSDQLKKMDYLSLVIKEVTRIAPAAIQIPRIVEEDYYIPEDNVVIPKGSTLLISIYGTHHDPTNFPNPDQFDPERFLNGKHNTDAYIPFGGGSRTCIGMNFSLMEQKVYLTMLLQKFTILINQNNPDFDKLRMTGFVFAEAEHLKLNLIPRF